MSYRVIAPLVLARDKGDQVHHVYQGGIIEWLSDEQAKHLLEAKMVEEIGGTPADDADPAAAVDNPPPAKAAPKADWVDYAVSRGWDRDEAEATSKADLIEALG